MIENSKSKIRQFLPMSFLSKSYRVKHVHHVLRVLHDARSKFRLGGPLFVTRITRGFLEEKGILKKSRNGCKSQSVNSSVTQATGTEPNDSNAS